MIPTIHRAKYVLAASNLLVRNGAVHVTATGWISSVETWRKSPGDGVGVVDWGTAVLMPGLVNAHTHLELSRLQGELGPAASFTAWLSKLIESRRGWSPDDYLDSVREGSRLSLRSGTTLVGDISNSGQSRQALKSERFRKVVFEEAIALAPDRAEESIANVNLRLSTVADDSLLHSGISPHAPYSVSPALYQGLAGLARLRDLPLATHLAETECEVDFLESGIGEFRGFLDALGAIPGDWIAPGLHPVAYLDGLGVLGRTSLLIHCNYLDEKSMSTIHRSRSSVIYCPRSSSFFGHENHPVRRLLDLGVNVALGTDSLASNDSLSMLDEMRFLARQRRDLDASAVLNMATVNGAAALLFAGQLGLLRAGYRADMIVLRLPEDPGPLNLPAQILEGAGEPSAAIVQGDIAWSRDLKV
jgi:cytosine/adenosine deaminase-related metal-dependent hydrolase